MRYDRPGNLCIMYEGIGMIRTSSVQMAICGRGMEHETPNIENQTDTMQWLFGKLYKEAVLYKENSKDSTLVYIMDYLVQ